MPNRNITNKINWVLDNLIPPLFRDSKFFMTPLMRLGLGKSYKDIMEFKDKFIFLSKEDIEKYYEKLGAGRVMKRKTDCSEESLAYIFEKIKTYPLPKEKKVLDAACGGGYILEELSKVMCNTELHGIDIVCNVKDNLAIHWHKGELEKLPFDDKSFDVVICTHALEHIGNYKSAVEELRRVCRRLLIVVLPRQREYRYTFDLHVNFFYYFFDVLRFMGKPQNENIKVECIKIKNDFVYLEEKDEVKKE